MDIIPGYAPCIVVRNDDPRGMGRIKVGIPGKMDETPYWVMPGNWPAKGPKVGSRYPAPDIQTIVNVIFAYGEYKGQNSQAHYFTGFYGENEDGSAAGPPTPASAPTAGEAEQYTTFWEDDDFRFYVKNSPTEKKAVLQAKSGGGKLEIDAMAGTDGKSEVVRVEARTSLILYSRGIVDIRGDCGVQLNGRKLNDLSTKPI